MTPIEIGSYIPGAENYINQADTDPEPTPNPEPTPEPGTPWQGCPDTDKACPY